MKSHPILGCGLAVWLSLIATTAAAHPKLISAAPAAGAIAAPGPTELRLTFNEAVLPRFSGAAVVDANGRAVATARSVTDLADKKVLVVPRKRPLAGGGYTVTWHAVAADTHRVQGRYSFVVK